MHITHQSSVASHIVELSPRLSVRLTCLAGEQGLETGDFVVSVLTEMGESSFQLRWSELLLLSPLTTIVVGNSEMEFTEPELTELERAGWLLLIPKGIYPTQWRAPAGL